MPSPKKHNRRIQFCNTCGQPVSCSLQACWKLLQDKLNQEQPKVGRKRRSGPARKQRNLGGRCGKFNPRRGRRLPNESVQPGVGAKSRIKRRSPKCTKKCTRQRRYKAAKDRRLVAKLRCNTNVIESESISVASIDSGLSVPAYKGVILKQMKRLGRRPNLKFEKEAIRAPSVYPITVLKSKDSSDSAAGIAIMKLETISEIEVVEEEEEEEQKEELVTNKQTSEKQVTAPEAQSSTNRPQQIHIDGELQEGEPNCFESTINLDIDMALEDDMDGSY